MMADPLYRCRHVIEEETMTMARNPRGSMRYRGQRLYSEHVRAPEPIEQDAKCCICGYDGIVVRDRGKLICGACLAGYLPAGYDPRQEASA